MDHSYVDTIKCMHEAIQVTDDHKLHHSNRTSHNCAAYIM